MSVLNFMAIQQLLRNFKKKGHHQSQQSSFTGDHEMSVSKLLATIHPNVVGIFQSGQKWWSNLPNNQQQTRTRKLREHRDPVNPHISWAYVCHKLIIKIVGNESPVEQPTDYLTCFLEQLSLVGQCRSHVYQMVHELLFPHEN